VTEATLRIRVHARGVEVTDELREHAERHVRFALSRFGAEVRRVTLELGERDSPAAVSGQHCSVEVVFRRAPSVVVEDFDASMYPAIRRAAERAGRAASRALAQLSDAAGGSRLRRGPVSES
jgi:ribosome-associated translation inhibitor RaiA